MTTYQWEVWEDAVKPLYLERFGMVEAPFSIAPDPRYLYMSPRHREALAHLLYGVKSDDGFVVLTGEVGAGKTTVCRCLLEQLPANCEVAFIFNPKLSVLELLATICEEFRIPVPEAAPGVKAYIDRINAWLLDVHAKGSMAVLIIDEAQSLDGEVLEQVRLLTNLETNRRKLLRIILLGQPQLRDLLARPDMTQLAQRIVARYHLGPLSRSDMKAYVAHRLAAAGALTDLFSPVALDRLYRLSGGIPRLVNIIADRALLGAYVRNRDRVDGGLILNAGHEVLGMQRASIFRGRGLGMATLALILIGGTAAAVSFYFRPAPSFPIARLAEQPLHAAGAAVVPAALNSPLPPALSMPITPAAVKPDPDSGTKRVQAAKPRPQPGNSDILRTGSRGPAVTVLRRDLDQVLGSPASSPDSPAFDQELADQVKKFQAAQGLPVTGMVGPLTRQRLAALKEPDKGKEP